MLNQPSAFANRSGPELSWPSSLLVDRRCGAGRHYVKSHRNKAGLLVKGRCVRDRVVRPVAPVVR